jgi:radical SAM superfamily enzyme YgiQ (UPF0313 family)
VRHIEKGQMNTLLIYPPFPDTAWSFKHALKFIRKSAVSPPLGLLTVAAMLPADWQKRLIDLNVTTLTDDDLAWADQVLISAMNVQRESARQVIARCKAAGLTVIAGGPLFTGEYLKFEQVDHFVLNEAEITLPLFLSDLRSGHPKRLYTTTAFPDIQKTPTPLWSLVDIKAYATMDIQFSRGCPYRCEFCNVTALLGHRVRTKTTTQIIVELNTLYDAGWRGGILFVDDNFIGNNRVLKTHLLPILAEWRRNKRGITFFAETSINLADDQELMQLMVEAGFRTVFIGIETPDEDSLAECGKLQNTKRDLVADVKRIHRSGLQVQGGFIVGFDNDTPSIFQRQVDLIQKSGIVMAMVGLLQALPGTRLYERLNNEGRVQGDVSEHTDGTTNIIPTMGLPVLRAGHKYILRNIYLPRLYYQRVRRFLREYQPPENGATPDLQQVLALPRSVLRLGIIGRERGQYWKLIMWTHFRRPHLLPLAIRLAIYGYHFRKIYKQNML